MTEHYLSQAMNARITSATLGLERDSFLCWHLLFESPRFQIGDDISFGGFVLDEFDKTQNKRIGHPLGTESIRRILEVIGVGYWHELEGQNCRVVRIKKQGEMYIRSIGHFLKEDWFDALSFFGMEDRDD